MVIYLVTNTVNGKQYVGKAVGPAEARWQQHVEAASRRRKSSPLYRAIVKYGSKNFTVEVIDRAEEHATLVELEKKWIAQLSTQEHGYNQSRRHLEAGPHCSDASVKSKPMSQRIKMAAYWDEDRRDTQAEVARKVNAVENQKIRDYVCPLCRKEFIQVRRSVFGGHRKACLRAHGVTPERPAPLELPDV